MKVYIDVSNLVSVNFLTGIQRVVREIVIRLYQRTDLELVLIAYANENQIYNIIDKEAFVDYFDKGLGSKNDFFSHRKLRVEDIESGSVFFDIDSVWNSRLRRSYLLPALRNQGVKIAVFVHDVLAVTHPQFAHQNTAFFFMDYIGATLMYADIIITSTQVTLDAINELSGKLGLPEKPGFVAALGSDFKQLNRAVEIIDIETQKALEGKRYALIVGTIEPRKNHTVLLRAFEKSLFDRDLCLVFAGRFGWNVDELKQKIENHPQLGKRFFHIAGANDATIDYLYKNAFCTLFPTFNEGFGLPLIESIERGVPVVASDIQVLKEIGNNYCEYFDPDNENELIAIIEKYLDKPAIYNKIKAHLADYVPFTWDKSADAMAKALLTLDKKFNIGIPEIKQMVILSARENMLLATIPFIEHFMSFIKEIVICCPDNVVNRITSRYQGNIELKFLTDSVVLAGNMLPEDHSHRNFYLRCLALQNDMIDDAFIMSDDDYRPICNIDLDVFVKTGKYQAYYCYDIDKWRGTAGTPTSYDQCMLRTADFLRENQYPAKQYSSHMPQAVDKRIFLAMLTKHRDIEKKGFCEWSTYFNFAQFYYPDLFDAVPYVSMCWPGAPTDWDMQVIPEKILFENYYPEQYVAGEVFEGFSEEYRSGIVHENVQKVMLYMCRQLQAEKGSTGFATYQKMYNYRYGENPIFLIDVLVDNIKIYLPKYLAIAKTGCTKVCFSVNNPDQKAFKLEYYYTKLNGDRLTFPDGVNVDITDTSIDLAVYGLNTAGDYILNILCSNETDEQFGQCRVIML